MSDNLENLNVDDFPNYKRFQSTYHLHNNGLRYSLYDNDGAQRCEWHNCTYNVYNSFDEPEDEVDLSGYQCTDARLGKYICCGQKINPEFVCWELDKKKDD